MKMPEGERKQVKCSLHFFYGVIFKCITRISPPIVTLSHLLWGPAKTAANALQNMINLLKNLFNILF